MTDTGTTTDDTGTDTDDSTDTGDSGQSTECEELSEAAELAKGDVTIARQNQVAVDAEVWKDINAQLSTACGYDTNDKMSAITAAGAAMSAFRTAAAGAGVTGDDVSGLESLLEDFDTAAGGLGGLEKELSDLEEERTELIEAIMGDGEWDADNPNALEEAEARYQELNGEVAAKSAEIAAKQGQVASAEQALAAATGSSDGVGRAKDIIGLKEAWDSAEGHYEDISEAIKGVLDNDPQLKNDYDLAGMRALPEQKEAAHEVKDAEKAQKEAEEEHAGKCGSDEPTEGEDQGGDDSDGGA